jgi:hypothetical protein
MTKEEFLDLVWRLEELLMQLDYLRNRVGKCGVPCEGLDAKDDEGLCPEYCGWFARVLAEEERLTEGKELDDVLKKLRQACDEDKTGEYERILKQSREGKVVH